MSKKLTYEFVKNQFEKDGYIPKFTEYINNKTKLGFICPNGHEHSMAWAEWQQGKRCGYCAGNIQLALCFIKDKFKKECYTCSSTEYINAQTRLDYTCPKEHKHCVTWSNWKKGHRCPSCFGNPVITI